MSEIALVVGVVKAIEPAINGLVNTYVSVVQSNNSTKVALRKIDAEMREAIANIREKGNVASNIIDVCSVSIQNFLNQTSLSSDQKFALIEKFTSTMLATLDRF